MVKSAGLNAGHKSADGVAAKGKTRTKKYAYGGLGQADGSRMNRAPAFGPDRGTRFIGPGRGVMGGGKPAPQIDTIAGPAPGARGPMPPIPAPVMGSQMPPIGGGMGGGFLGGGGAAGAPVGAPADMPPFMQQAALQNVQNQLATQRPNMGFKKGGAVKKMAKGGACAKGEHSIQKKGHTRGKIIGMKKGGVSK